MSQTLSRAWLVGTQFDRLVLASSRWERRGPKTFGKKEWFVRHEDSAEAEALWKTVEDKIPVVRQLVDDRTALDTDDSTNVLRDVVALHLVRSNQFIEIHDRVRELVADRHRAEPENIQFLARHLFHEKFRFEPVDSRTWEIALEPL